MKADLHHMGRFTDLSEHADEVGCQKLGEQENLSVWLYVPNIHHGALWEIIQPYLETVIPNKKVEVLISAAQTDMEALKAISRIVHTPRSYTTYLWIHFFEEREYGLMKKVYYETSNPEITR